MPDEPGRKILLDENVNNRLLSLFDDDLFVTTVKAQGWTGLSNGDLVREAAGSFEVFMTRDSSLPFQQNLEALDIGVVIVRALSNALVDLAPLMPEVNRAVRMVERGKTIVVDR